MDEIIKIEIDGILDLHAFSPKDLKYLIPDYINECLKKDIYQIRFIHGKGKGNIRRSVHALLERNKNVASFSQADQLSGGWGATNVLLKKEGSCRT